MHPPIDLQSEEKRWLLAVLPHTLECDMLIKNIVSLAKENPLVPRVLFIHGRNLSGLIDGLFSVRVS